MMDEFSQERLVGLLDRYLDDGLQASEVTELGEILMGSKEARAIYWEVSEMNVLMERKFGEQRGGELGKVIGVIESERRSGNMFGWWAAAAALVLGMWLVLSGGSRTDQEPGITVVATLESWEGGVRLLEVGMFVLESGKEAELVFRDGARVALEGPAEVELISAARMRLVRGKIGVEVPPGAEGFTVDTPGGQVVDYGTRFGVEVEDSGEFTAEVFEGRIDVSVGDEVHRMEGQASLHASGLGTAEVIRGSDPRSYPQPTSKLSWPVSGGFDALGTQGIDRPTEFNKWSGDWSEVVGGGDGIEPKKGEGMLQFKATYPEGTTTQVSNVAAQVWRVIDLDEVAEKLGRRPTGVQMAGWFNRARGGSATDRKFIMTMIGGYDFESEDMVVENRTELFTDGDLETWERADLQMTLPEGIRYLLLEVGAFEDIRNDESVGVKELDGHFVDEIGVIFYAGMRSSARERHWRGAEGKWQDASKWSENVVPSGEDQAVIQGEGAAVVDESILIQGWSLVIALDDSSEGELIISESGTMDSGAQELLIGYNPGGEARMIVRGRMNSAGTIFVGRNNAESVLEIDGGHVVTSRGLILSQYDSAADTRSSVIMRNEAELVAESLQMLHDITKFHLEDGRVDVGVLQIGGDNGEAVFRQEGGLVRAGEMGLGNGRYELIGGRIELKGEWTAEEFSEIVGERMEPGVDELTFTSDGDGWTVIERR